MKAVIFAVCVLALVGVQAQNTFCQRYTTALFTANTAANQKALLNAVVVTAATGAKNSKFLNTTGLFADPDNKPYFDGTKAPMINFPADATQLTALVDHLVRFFAKPLGCVEFAATADGTWKEADLKTIHAPMAITKKIMDAFIFQVAGSLVSYGVPYSLTPTSDLMFPAAFLGVFNKGSAMEICSAADCDMWTDLLPFAASDTKFWVAGQAETVNTGKVVKGGYVHWDLTATDNIVEAESATATTPKSGGKTSGAPSANVRSYTVKMDTVGTFWFYSDKDKANKRVVVEVVEASFAFASASVNFVAMFVAALFALVTMRQ